MQPVLGGGDDAGLSFAAEFDDLVVGIAGVARGGAAHRHSARRGDHHSGTRTAEQRTPRQASWGFGHFGRTSPGTCDSVADRASILFDRSRR